MEEIRIFFRALLSFPSVFQLGMPKPPTPRWAQRVKEGAGRGKS